MTKLNMEHLQELLAPFSDTRFALFPDSKQDYLEILAGCHGIISTAGHSLL